MESGRERKSGEGEDNKKEVERGKQEWRKKKREQKGNNARKGNAGILISDEGLCVAIS